MPTIKREVAIGDICAVLMAIIALIGAAASYGSTTEQINTNRTKIEWIDKNGTSAEHELKEELVRARIAIAELSTRMDATNKNFDRFLDRTK